MRQGEFDLAVLAPPTGDPPCATECLRRRRKSTLSATEATHIGVNIRKGKGALPSKSQVDERRRDFNSNGLLHSISVQRRKPPPPIMKGGVGSFMVTLGRRLHDEPKEALDILEEMTHRDVTMAGAQARQGWREERITSLFERNHFQKPFLQASHRNLDIESGLQAKVGSYFMLVRLHHMLQSAQRLSGFSMAEIPVMGRLRERERGEP